MICSYLELKRQRSRATITFLRLPNPGLTLPDAPADALAYVIHRSGASSYSKMGETESYEFRAILNCPPRRPLSARKDNGLSLSRHHPERPRGRIADHIAQVEEQHVCTSIIVAAELRYVLPRKPLRVSLRSWKPCWALLKCLPWNRPSTQFMVR